MELVIIVLLIAYAVVKDVLFYKERDRLQNKLMSRDLKEYTNTIAPPPANTVTPEATFIDIEDASIDQILKAKDRT